MLYLIEITGKKEDRYVLEQLIGPDNVVMKKRMIDASNHQDTLYIRYDQPLHASGAIVAASMSALLYNEDHEDQVTVPETYELEFRTAHAKLGVYNDDPEEWDNL